MGYFSLFKGKQKPYVGVGKKAVDTQAKKRDQLKDAAGSGSVREYPHPTKKLTKRKKKISGND